MIKLSGNDVTFGENTVSQSGQRMVTKSGIRPSVLSGKRLTGFHWNGHRFPPPESGSVLYLPGYPAQGSVIQDFSGQGNHGAITGATWKKLPSGLWYLDFDGNNQDVDLGKDVSLSLTGDLTIKFWSKGGGSSDYFIANINAGIDRYQYSLLIGTGDTLRWQSRSSAGTDDFDNLGGARGDSWIHTVVTLAGTALEYCLNGVDQGLSISVTYRCLESERGNTFLGRAGDWGGAGDLLGQMALEEIAKGRAWTVAQATSSYQQERHLFGV